MTPYEAPRNVARAAPRFPMLPVMAAAVLLGCAAPHIERVDGRAPHGPALQPRVTGRVLSRTAEDGGVVLRRQWPGTVVEMAFRGSGALFFVGEGDTALRVVVDDRPLAVLLHPSGAYRVSGLAAGPHRLRIQVASEDQSGPTELGPFYAAAGDAALPAPTGPASQIEFIGDSYTVGSGNTLSASTCTDSQAWTATDSTQAVGAQVGRRYGADVEINAISGRGLVRNYGGFAAPTVPQAYPFVLLTPSPLADDATWRPQTIVVSLGTNDFSTPLHPGEAWADRTALQADFEATYVRFLRSLRARYSSALIIVWATDVADGQVAEEADRVVQTLSAAGDSRVRFLEVRGLTFAACNGHPTTSDDAVIAAALSRVIDAQHPS